MDDPGPGNLIVKLIVLFILILVNAFFAMSEIAVISLNESKLRKMAEEGHKKAQKVLRLTADSSAFLSTIQIGITLAGFLTSASAADNFSEPLAATLAGWFHVTDGAALSFLSAASLVVVTIIISYFSLVLGELVPKRIAMQRAEAVSFRVVGILLGVKAVMRPFIWFLSVSTNLVGRLFGLTPGSSQEAVTEEEIRLMVDAGEETGVIEESQKDMINNIFEFDDIDASDVMTHRTDMEAVEINDSIEDVLTVAINDGFSRIPVYEEDLDNIKGILYVKDLLPYVGKAANQVTLKELMRPATYVPESKKCGDLFSEMTEKHLQMVIVSDEYGGTAGLVTIEDLLESIVGNIQDEFDNEEEEFQKLDEDTFTIDGTADIEEVDDLLDVTLPEGEYDTIGGMIMAEIGRIPEPGEHPSVEIAGFRFTVEEVEERRIERVKIERLPEPPAEEEAGKSDKKEKGEKKSDKADKAEKDKK